MEIIKITDLNLTLDDIDVIKNLNLTVNKSDFVVICGKSGSGKSTLLKYIKSMYSTDDCAMEKLKIGYVSQDPETQIVTDTVWHELAFPLENLGLSQTDIRVKVAEISTFFGITHLFHNKTSTLSGGQKQLINLASAMILNPDVLILDEPLSQLDPISKAYFLDTLTKLNDTLGTTIILSEHDLSDIFHRSTKVVLLDDGKVFANDCPVEVAKKIISENHSFYHSLPSQFKIWSSINSKTDFPRTSKQFRDWIKLYSNTNFSPIDAKNLNTNDILNIKNLYVKYSETSTDTIKNLSFAAKSGEISSILGANGAGKTTVLKVISKIIKPYRGKMVLPSNIAYLPQDPRMLISKSTVKEELNVSENTQIIDFFNLTHLLHKHPFDLSGGEIQRVALAKIMQETPDILLLDEPTKGLDNEFKNKLSSLLKSIASNGTTVIMITHDMDFCAKISDKVSLMFDGQIVLTENPRTFFSNNKFYTTTANLISRDFFDDLITDEEVIHAIGGKIKDFPQDNTDKITPTSYNSKQAKLDINASKPKFFQLIYAILTSTLFIIATNYIKNYYFTSFFLLFLIIIPPFFIFEKSKIKTSELVLISIFCVMAILSRSIFFMIPQFKPILGIIILSSVCTNANIGFIIGALSMLISNIQIAHGPWTPWQMLSMGLIGYISGCIFSRNITNKYLLSIWGFLSTLVVYGCIMNYSSAIMMSNSVDFKVFLTYAVAGFPLDLIFAISTFLTIFILHDSFFNKIKRIKDKYNLNF